MLNKIENRRIKKDEMIENFIHEYLIKNYLQYKNDHSFITNF